MNKPWILAGLGIVTAALVLTLLIWNPAMLSGEGIPAALPAVLAGLVAVLAVMRKPSSATNAPSTTSSRKRRKRLFVLIGVIGLVVGLTAALMEDRDDVTAPLRSEGEAVWLVLALIIGIALLMFVVRRLKADKAQLPR